MRHYFSEEKLQNYFLALLVFGIFPFIILTFFSHPSADDFFYSEKPQSWGFWESQYQWYKYWTGKYFSTFLLSVTPLYFKSITGYRFELLILILGFFTAVYFFFSTLAPSGLTVKQKLLLTLSFVFIYLYGMPTVSQGLYWLTGSAVYTVAMTLLLLFFIIYFRMNRSENKSSIVSMLFLSLIVVAAAGCSEISMIFLNIALISICFISLFSKKRFDRRLIILLLFSVICSYIVISSGGNEYRSALFPDRHNLFFSLYHTGEVLVRSIFVWSALTPLIAMTILLIPIIIKFSAIENSSKLTLINPLYSVLITCAVLYVLIFVSVWSTGKSPYDRTLNFSYMIFLLGYFYSSLCLMSYLKTRFKFDFNKIPRLIYIAAFIFCTLIFIRKNSIKYAWTDLASGKAGIFSEEVNQRYDLIQSTGSDSITVASIITVPRTLFYTDILTDGESDLNKWYAYYFGKKFIAIKK
ncbi:MAG: DUF6056 family protein [bacterium]